MLRVFVGLYVAFAVAGCVSHRRSSPLGEMMALTAKGEIACVRNDVVMRGRDACR
jgi:hypothetical protein